MLQVNYHHQRKMSTNNPYFGFVAARFCGHLDYLDRFNLYSTEMQIVSTIQPFKM